MCTIFIATVAQRSDESARAQPEMMTVPQQWWHGCVVCFLWSVSVMLQQQCSALRVRDSWENRSKAQALFSVLRHSCYSTIQHIQSINRWQWSYFSVPSSSFTCTTACKKQNGSSVVFLFSVLCLCFFDEPIMHLGHPSCPTEKCLCNPCLCFSHYLQLLRWATWYQIWQDWGKTWHTHTFGKFKQFSWNLESVKERKSH